SAFDDALFEAGIGNYNLVKVSSILPPNCKPCDTIDLPDGSPLHVAWQSIIVKPTQTASSGILLIPALEDAYGLIIEIADYTTEDLLRTQLKKSAFERCAFRNITQRFTADFIYIRSTENMDYVLNNESLVCLFTGVALF
ncbi:MAG: pyruvoyl-dependent arginine decarboxylase, partial [Sulfolobaceae archaeon]